MDCISHETSVQYSTVLDSTAQHCATVLRLGTMSMCTSPYSPCEPVKMAMVHMVWCTWPSWRLHGSIMDVMVAHGSVMDDMVVHGSVMDDIVVHGSVRVCMSS